jgi:glucose-1-phosphate cytidylyltransferase
VFDYLEPDSELEREPLVALARDGELFAFRHEGFFQPVRSGADGARLERLWASGHAPWLAA